MDVRASLAEILGWVGSGHLAKDPRLTQVDQARYDADARRLAALAETEDGRWLLELLADLTVRRPPVNHALTGADYLAYAQLRQGQDQVFAALGEYLNHADQLEKTHAARSRDAARRTDPLAGPFPDAYAGPAPDPDAGPGGGFDPAGAVAVR